MNDYAPVADAGDGQTATSGATVTLDGSGSSDADGDALTYSWTKTAGPAVTLSDSSAVKPTFAAPDVSGNTTITFSLTVSDGLNSDSDTVSITVQPKPANSPPTANDDTQHLNAGQTVTISVLANDSDPDGDSLTIQSITQPSYGTATIGTGGLITYTAHPTYHGTTTFAYTLADGKYTDTATVTVSIGIIHHAGI